MLMEGRGVKKTGRWAGLACWWERGRIGHATLCEPVRTAMTCRVRRIISRSLAEPRFFPRNTAFVRILVGELSHSRKEWQSEAGGGKTSCLSAFL